MPYRITFSSRKAKCKECGDRIGDMDPRIDHERDDAPEGEEKAGWHTRRFCLKCGLKKMQDDLKELAQRVKEATNVWNLISRRMRWDKKKQAGVPAPKTKKCPTKDCNQMGVMIINTRGCGKLYICDNKHFWIE
jgi:hypothetical protein